MTTLKDLREEYGASLKGLAEASGVPESSIVRYESGERDILRAPYVTVYRLCKALGCKPADLLGELPRVRRAPKRLRALPKKD